MEIAAANRTMLKQREPGKHDTTLAIPAHDGACARPSKATSTCLRQQPLSIHSIMSSLLRLLTSEQLKTCLCTDSLCFEGLL